MNPRDFENGDFVSGLWTGREDGRVPVAKTFCVGPSSRVDGATRGFVVSSFPVRVLER